jgi:excisionase family DNA binding protein
MGKKTTSPDDIISTSEAARILGLKERQTRQHAIKGRIPSAVQAGRNWVFRRADVLAAKGKFRKPGRPAGMAK